MNINKLYQPVHRHLRFVALAMLGFVTVILVLGAVPSGDAISASDSTLMRHIAYLEDQQRTLNLAVEFGYDPLIVHTVRRLSADVYSREYCACPTWRFIGSSDELSYLMLSIIQVESRGDYRAYNPGGPAYGLTQLLLSTAKQYDRNVSPAQLLTIPTSLTIAMRHFVDLLERHTGNKTLAVIAWNRGSGGVDRSIALGQSPENGYARMVFTQAAMRNAQ